MEKTSDSLDVLPSWPELLGEEGESISTLLIDHHHDGDDDELAGMLKKLNRNFSERHRRKKISDLYASLFSLLPPTHQTKKLSTQATVSCVLKYIPELQKEVEALLQKKETLSSLISTQQQVQDLDEQRVQSLPPANFIINNNANPNLLAVAVNPIGANQVATQICAQTNDPNEKNNLLSQVLRNLEEEQGLLLLNASSFESLGENKVFYTLHFQVEESYKLEPEIIRGKILSLYRQEE